MSTTTSSTTTAQHWLYPALSQMYRADLMKIATALGCRPRSGYYKDSSDLVTLIVQSAGDISLKDDWLLRVDVPWTMFKPQPCLDVLKWQKLEQLNVSQLREICRQYSIRRFSRLATKAGLLHLVREALDDTQQYPPKTYISRITARPIPPALLSPPDSVTR